MERERGSDAYFDQLYVNRGRTPFERAQRRAELDHEDDEETEDE